MKQTCLITGGAGFIGAHVTRELIKNHYKTIVLDDLSGGFEENIPEKHSSSREASLTMN